MAHFWTEEENNFIIENYKKYSKQELCEHFKVSKSSIMHKFQRLGITEKSIMGKSYKWSDKEIEYLKENWLYKEDVEIWHELGIDKTGFSHYVVQRKRKQLGLVGKSKRIRQDKKGYEYYIDYDKKVFIHRKLIEDIIGRKLTILEIVHHIDGNPSNNDKENLLLCPDNSAHQQIHNQLQQIAFKLVQAGIIKFDKNKLKYFYDI